MNTYPKHPLRAEYLQSSALITLDDLSRKTENFNLIGALIDMHLRTVCSDGFRLATEEGKAKLQADFEAIKYILEELELWSEHREYVENGENDDDILLTFTQERGN